MKTIRLNWKWLGTFFVLATLCTSGLQAQSGDIRWTLMRSWAGSFNKALPDVSTNLQEFRTQYQRNKAQWDALFAWLQEHDVTALPAGRHPIEGTSLVASIEDTENEPLEKRNSESHYRHIDFQWVVKGTERFGLLDHRTSTPRTPYKPDIISYDYQKEKTQFIDSVPERFFLFFPSDWHIAKVATDKPSQKIRVVVVKLDYIEAPED